MTKFAFDDYVRATMGGATNVSDGSKLSQDQIERVTSYLKSSGSGPDATGSYETYLTQQMAAHPPSLPGGVDYVGFSGTDSLGNSNFKNAVNYTHDVNGRAGIIGDTAWGKFIDTTPGNPDFANIKGKFEMFLSNEGIQPYGKNVESALQDMMWNAGSSPYFTHAVESGRPVVGFVENAPLNRGFSTFELPTALGSPATVMNGYPMGSFGPDPLAFASQSAAQFQQLEVKLAAAATIHSGRAIGVPEIRANVDMSGGYDALHETMFGQPIDDFSGLNIDQMTAASRAWSAAHPAVAKAGPAEPNVAESRPPTVEQHPPTGPPALDKVTAADNEAAIRMRGPSLPGGAAATGMAVPELATKGLGVVGAAAIAYDATTTVQRTSDLLQSGNRVGSQSEIVHFGSRNLGMLAGAELTATAGAALGVESGPGMLVTGAIGGVAGAIGGNKIADAVDSYRINHQSDAQGNTWRFEPGQGWGRDVPPLPGSPHPQRHMADAALSDRLNFQASNTAAELSLAHPAAPKDPYSQPAGPGDAPSVGNAPWTRDAQTLQWSRRVTDEVVEHNIPIRHTETATPEKAALLNRASDQVIAENLATSPRAIAERYKGAYENFGWQQHGPMPEAVTTALHAPVNTLEASDGHTYTRAQDGQWNTPGMLYGSNVAEGNVRRELDATQQASSRSEAARSPHAAPVGDVAAHPAHDKASNEQHVITPVTHTATERGLAAPTAHVHLDHPSHPDHALYQQARGAVQRLDKEMGRTPDQRSDNLAASLTVAARRDGLKQIDHAQISRDGTHAFAIEGDVRSLTNKSAHVETAHAVQTPIAQSSVAWEHAQQQKQLEQSQAQVQATQQQQSGPVMSR